MIRVNGHPGPKHLIPLLAAGSFKPAVPPRHSRRIHAPLTPLAIILLAAILPPRQVIVIKGTHSVATIKKLWARMLDKVPF